MPSDSRLTAAARRLAAAQARARRLKLGPVLASASTEDDAQTTPAALEAVLSEAEVLVRDAGGALGAAMFRAKRAP